MTWKLALSGTLTMVGIVLVSIFFSLVGSVKKVSLSSFGKRFSSKSGAIILFLVLFFTVGVLYSGLKTLQQNKDINIYLKNRDEGIESRLENKILADRLPFWYAAFEQIISGPYIIVPSGRPLKIIGITNDWVVGAHNTILEMLRLNGLVAGSFILYIYFFGLRNLIVVLGNSNIRFLRTLAAGLLSVAIVGMTTGDFPADQTIGFWIWSISGLVNGLYTRENKGSSYI